MFNTGEIRQRRGEFDSLPTRNTVDTSKSLQGSRRNGRFSMLCGIIFILLLSPVAFLLLVDLLLESPIKPESFSLAPPREFVGSLTANTALSSASRIFEGELSGPEAIIVDHGHIYTGTSDGKILHIHRGDIQVVTSLGKPPCGRFEDEPTCGRPLGMRFNQDGYLIVVDAYLGLFKVNVVTGDVFQLYSSTTEIEGERPMLLNDIDIAEDGKIYITDSSTKWDRRHNRLLVLEAGSHGRVLVYDPSTEKMSVLLRGLRFPNGIQLSKQNDYFLVAESTMCRILKYYLNGPKAGTQEIFAENLPGIPDNIRPSSTGGFWVPLALVRRPDTLNLFDLLADHVWIRRLVAKLISQEMIITLARSNYGLIVELNKSGEIIRSLHDPTGKVMSSVSTVVDDVGILYLGSYDSTFMGRLNTNTR